MATNYYLGITRSACARKIVQPFFPKGHFSYKNTCKILLSCIKGKFPVAVLCEFPGFAEDPSVFVPSVYLSLTE